MLTEPGTGSGIRDPGFGIGVSGSGARGSRLGKSKAQKLKKRNVTLEARTVARRKKRVSEASEPTRTERAWRSSERVSV